MPDTPNDLVASWIKDGTAAAEPVTVETPAPELEPVATTDPPRDPLGRFLSPDPVSAAAPATPSTPAPVPVDTLLPGATATQVQEFIEARLADGTAFQVPKGLTLPIKRNGKVEFEPIDRVLAERMMERDYRIKTAETARIRTEAEQATMQARSEAARLEARQQWLTEQETAMREAQKDPVKWQAYQEMLALYESNPLFRSRMDDALAKRETDAENAIYRDQNYQAQVQHGATLAADWIHQVGQAPEFAGVNPERVRVLYAQALQAGQAQLSPEAVRQIYEHEAGYVRETVSPLHQELADLRAQIAALQAAKVAEATNQTTTHALARAKTPKVASTGAPLAPAVPVPQGRFGPGDLPERNASWARAR